MPSFTSTGSGSAGIVYVGSAVWASRPAASSNSGATFFCSDVGDGVLLLSNGRVWRGVSDGAIRLASGAVGVGIPSSGSIGNNGALTGLTAFNQTYAEGIYLYFPANAISAGSAAGFYFTVMSSTTAGTIYANTYSSGTPYPPSSNTAFVTTGPGAYVQTTASDISIISVTVPGGMMGSGGVLACECLFEYKSSANNKTVKLKYGASTFAAPSAFTTTGSARISSRVQNYNSEAKQRFTSTGQTISMTPSSSGASTSWVTSSENSATDLSFAATGQLAVDTDHIVVPAFNLIVLPA